MSVLLPKKVEMKSTKKKLDALMFCTLFTTHDLETVLSEVTPGNWNGDPAGICSITSIS